MSVVKPIQYTLFETDKFKTKYPEHFVNSNNDKYVSVISAHAFYDLPSNSGQSSSYTRPEYWQLHASFIQDEDSMDHYVCTFNDPLYHKRKFRQYNNSQDFEIWITDYKGTKIEPDKHTFIIIELLLQY